MTSWLLVADPQFGNGGKGKVLATLAGTLQPFACIECGSGPSGAHEIHYAGQKIRTSYIPPGFISSARWLGIGRGVALFEELLFSEIERLSAWQVQSRLAIHPECRVLERGAASFQNLGFSEILDIEARCAAGQLGTPCAALPFWSEYAERWQIVTANWRSETVLVIAQHGYRLHPSIGDSAVPQFRPGLKAVSSQLGIEDGAFSDVILVVKAMPTTTTAMDLPEEIPWPSNIDREYGLVSGRAARISARPDFDLLREAKAELKATSAVLMFGDYLARYAGPAAVDQLVEEIEHRLELPILFVSTGPRLEQVEWRLRPWN